VVLFFCRNLHFFVEQATQQIVKSIFLVGFVPQLSHRFHPIARLAQCSGEATHRLSWTSLLKKFSAGLVDRETIDQHSKRQL
jgi:hypothetical protein